MKRIILLGCVLFPGCGGSGGGSPDPEPTPTLQVMPGAAVVGEGGLLSFQANLLTPGQLPAEISATWTSSNPLVASIGASSGIAQAGALGQSTITAVSVSDPLLKASTILTVSDGRPVFAYDRQVGLLRFDGTGSPSSVLPLSALGTAPTGIDVRPDAVYLLFYGHVWKVDPLSGEAEEVAIFAGYPACTHLAVDSGGNFYTADDFTNKILRYDRASGAISTFAQLPPGLSGIPSVLVFDGGGNLYVMIAIPSRDFVYRISPALDGVAVMETIVENPGPVLEVWGGGLAVTTPGGPLYVLDWYGQQLYQGRAGPDGLYQLLPCAHQFALAHGICTVPEGLLVNDYDANAVFLLRDLDNSGEFYAPGELMVWSDRLVDNGQHTARPLAREPLAP